MIAHQLNAETSGVLRPAARRKTGAIVADLEAHALLARLDQYFDAGARVLHGVIDRLLGDLVERRGRIERQPHRRIEQSAGWNPEILAVPAHQPVQGELQSGSLDDGWIQLVAEIAHLRHGLLQHFLNIQMRREQSATFSLRSMRSRSSCRPIALSTCPTSSCRMRETRAPSSSRACMTLTRRSAKDRCSGSRIAQTRYPSLFPMLLLSCEYFAHGRRRLRRA